MQNISQSSKEVGIQAQIRELLQCHTVPSLSQVARKLIKLCKNTNVDFRELALTIESDAGLATRILKVSNSSYYGLPNNVSTVHRAITLLGLNYVKAVCLGFKLSDFLKGLSSDPRFFSELWRQNLLRGVLAREIAKHYCPNRAEEAFLVGLLQDCGVPILAEVLGKEYVMMWQICHGSQASLYKLEREVFQYDHVMAAEIMTDHWSLPDVLAKPIQTHHRRPAHKPSSNEIMQLRQVGYFVGTLSLNDPALLCEDDLSLLKYCEAVFQIEPEGLKSMFRSALQEFRDISEFFREVLPEKENSEELFVQANLLLSEIMEGTSREIFNMEKEVKRLKTYCAMLNISRDEYEQRAKTDNLTGLYRRESLERYLDHVSEQVQRRETSLMVAFFDIDGFKKINDTHSHAVGDRVLKEIGALFRKLFSEKGCGARYGGDEFAVGLTGLDRNQAEQMGQLLMEKIRDLDIPIRAESGRDKLHITCSMGVVFFEKGAIPGTSDQVLDLVDKAMYGIKREGGNDIRFQTVDATADSLSN